MKATIGMIWTALGALAAGTVQAQVGAPSRPAQPTVRVAEGVVRMPPTTVRIVPTVVGRMDPTRFGVRLDPSRFGVRLDSSRWGVRLPRNLQGEVPFPDNEADTARQGPEMTPAPEEPILKAGLSPDALKKTRRHGDLKPDRSIAEGCVGGPNACVAGNGMMGVDPRLTAPSEEESSADDAPALPPRDRALALARERDWAGAAEALAEHASRDPKDFDSARDWALLLVLAGDCRAASGVMHRAYQGDPTLAQKPARLSDLGLGMAEAQELTRAVMAWAERERTPAAYLTATAVAQARQNPIAVRRLLERGERAGLDPIIVSTFAAATSQPTAGAQSTK